MRIGACLHVTTETANLMRTLEAGGAELALCASNPLSTQDDVAAALVVEYGISTFAIKGEDRDTYYRHIQSVIDIKPQITMDDGADLVGLLHTERTDAAAGVIGGTEETTTGVIRLKSMEQDGVLRYPIIAVNEAMTKHMFDNRYGTGQSTLDGIIRATNRLIAGKIVVVAGYGWCGRGCGHAGQGPRRRRGRPRGGSAARARGGHGRLPGHAHGRGRPDRRHLRHRHRRHPRHPQGALRGHEGRRDRRQLRPLQRGDRHPRARRRCRRARRRVREFVDEFTLADGRRIYLLGEGRLINLAAAEGHPASVMDMSFANQALAAEYMVKNAAALEKRVYDVPAEIDAEIARLKLAAMGIHRHAHPRTGEVPRQLEHGDLNGGTDDPSRRPRRETRQRPCRPAPVDSIRPLVWRDGAVIMIDQRRLPLEEDYVHCPTWQQVADAICTMAVRGAPALGVAAGMGMALAARTALACRRELALATATDRFRPTRPVSAAVQAASKGLFETRPTAYNLPGRSRRWSDLEQGRPVTRGDCCGDASPTGRTILFSRTSTTSSTAAGTRSASAT